MLAELNAKVQDSERLAIELRSERDSLTAAQETAARHPPTTEETQASIDAAIKANDAKWADRILEWRASVLERDELLVTERSKTRGAEERVKSFQRQLGSLFPPSVPIMSSSTSSSSSSAEALRGIIPLPTYTPQNFIGTC